MTLQELSDEVGMTVKTLRQYIRIGQLKASCVKRGRIHRTYEVTRDQADGWLAWRAHRKITRTLPSVLQRGAKLRQDPLRFFPDNDLLTMNNDLAKGWDAMKQAALDGDVKARLLLGRPWEEGGLNVSAWWTREAGTII